MIQKLAFICSFILFIWLSSSCKNEPKPLNKEEEEMVARLARKQTDSLTRTLDSACIRLVEQSYIALSDSLLQKRIEEIRLKMEETQ